MNVLSIDEIMERLSRICQKRHCYVQARPDFPSGPSKWFVALEGVFLGSIQHGGCCGFFENGATPEEAIQKTWDAILAYSKNSESAFMRVNCPPNVPIPGEEPQVWVRWDNERDDWIDVPIPRLRQEQLRTYIEQRWLDRCD